MACDPTITCTVLIVHVRYDSDRRSAVWEEEGALCSIGREQEGRSEVLEKWAKVLPSQAAAYTVYFHYADYRIRIQLVLNREFFLFFLSPLPFGKCPIPKL